MKVFADTFLAIFCLIALLPFLVLVAIIIFLPDGKSPFFMQQRVGKNKNLFRIIKFRTMWDGKITRVGKVLRKTGIDELPQLVNILFGQMSFVGPRPLTQDDIERLEWTSDYYDKRWNMRPGIVGLAQLSPICHKRMSWYLDQYYVLEQSFWLDMKILSFSVLIPIVGKAQMKKWLHAK